MIGLILPLSCFPSFCRSRIRLLCSFYRDTVWRNMSDPVCLYCRSPMYHVLIGLEKSKPHLGHLATEVCIETKVYTVRRAYIVLEIALLCFQLSSYETHPLSFFITNN